MADQVELATQASVQDAHDQACDCRARRSIRDRLLALAPHLWPSVSHKAAWERLVEELKQMESE